jgi:long-chain fatty acid transport protein
VGGGNWPEIAGGGEKEQQSSFFRQGNCFISVFRAVSELKIAMKTNLRIAATYLLAVILAGSTSSLWGTGFRIPDQDAFATARGEAFVATADNASAIYYNPAGLTQLEGQNLRGGVYGLYFNPRYTSPSTGQTFNNEKDLHAIPQVFYSWTLDSLPLALGLGVYSPYGLSSEWDQDTGFRKVATEGSITTYTINPTVAWRVLPNLSLGAGLRVNYGEVDLKQGIFWPSQAFDQFHIKGDGWALGYDVGVLWKPHEKIALGAAFKSTTSFNFEGHTDYYNNVAYPPGVGAVPAFPDQSAGANTEWELPLNVVCGISYRPTTNWNFEFDADYTDWSSLGTETIHQASGGVLNLPQSLPLKLNWQGSWYYEFGATRYLANGWSVSGGYIYNENSVPDATYNPLVADLDRHFISVGAGHKGKHFSFDVAYQFGFGPTRTVSGSASSGFGPPLQNADGKYEFFSHAVFVSAGWHF